MLTRQDLEDMGYFEAFDEVKEVNLSDYAEWVENKIKKHVRDKTPLDKEGVTLEAGDVFFYYVALLNVLDIKLKDVIKKNMQKLDSREKRDKIKGSGDYR